MGWRSRWRRFRSVRRIVHHRSTDNIGRSLSAAWDIAVERGHSSITPKHVLAGMVMSGLRLPRSILNRLGIVIDPDEATDFTGPIRTDRTGIPAEFDLSTRSLLTTAREQARSLGHPYIGTEHLLLALLHDPDRPSKGFLERRGVQDRMIREALVPLA